MNVTTAVVSIPHGKNAPRRSRAGGWRRLVVVGAAALLLVGLVWTSLALQEVTASTSAARSLNSDHLYNLTNVWTIHLTFTPDQWEAMEPKDGFNPFGGGPRGAAPGGRPGGFGAAKGDRSLAPVIMSQGDTNRDGRISPEEFARLAQRWFEGWDATGAGRLDESQIRAGLDTIRNPAGSGVATMLLAPEGKRNGIAAALGIEFEYVHADLEFEGRRLSNVGVRYKGNGTFMESRDSLKRSLKIETDKYVNGQSLGGVKALNLHNNVTDASLMNEVLAYRLYRDAGVPAPRTAYARVFVTVPGKHEREYFGLYSMSEAVDKAFAERHFGTKHGAVFKPVTPSLFTDLGADWAAYNQVYDPKGTVQDEHKSAVMALAQFVTQADEATFAGRIGQFIDLPEFARFMAIMVYLSDLDGILGPGQNLYLHLHPKSPHFRFIPWDQDRSWGQFNRASQEQRDRLSIHRPWQGENFFLERMFKVEAFKKLYLARLDEFGQTIFKRERIAQQVDQIAAVIRPAVREESEAKLARFDKVVAGEFQAAPGPFGGGQTKPIKPFAQVRTQSVLDQLAGKSEGLSPGSGFPGGTSGSDLGRIFGRSLLQALDGDQDSSVTQGEFTQGFARLFQAWNTDQGASLIFEQVRSGIAKDLPPQSAGFSPFGGGARRDRGFPGNAPAPTRNTPASEQRSLPDHPNQL